MCELSENQIAMIVQDVEMAGINFSHLDADLIDHVCCDIESHMNQGVSFDLAYDQIKEELGIKGLRQIQQNTLMLIDKNYRIMKKSMKTIGVLAMSLMAFGAMFKIFHWPGASIMLTVSFFFTAVVFFPSLLFIMYKEGNQKKQNLLYVATFIGGVAFMCGVLFKIMHWPGAHKLLLIGIGLISYVVLPLTLVAKLKRSHIHKGVLLLAFVSIIMFVSGLLFKMMHWPGASFLLTFGSIILIFVAVPLYYRTEIRKSRNLRIDFLFGIIALNYFIIMTFLLSINQSKNGPSGLPMQHNAYIENAIYFKTINQTALDSCSDVNIQQFCSVSDKLLHQMEELKITIVQSANELERETAKKALNNKRTDIYSTDFVKFLLKENNAYTQLPVLLTDMESYVKELDKKELHNVLDAELMRKLFNMNGKTSDYDYWESTNFRLQTVEASLVSISLWQYTLELNKNILLTKTNTYPKN